MADVVLTNAQLLIAYRDLRGAKSNNGLTAVKLHRIRRALAADVEPVALEWGKVDERFALRADGGPKVREQDGKPLAWTLTGTPCFQYDAAYEVERQSALREFDAGTLTISAPLLAEQDLAWIESDRDIGETLALFTES